ncbi:hypothetical protein FHT82_003033 [Rhizobium sp. BK275]|uniref:hypothetical protein n=1 Tax=unclassified Rhizobium TaxID=2613769 RepID=UPI001611DB36|nr:MULTISPECIES: hypothetical protein [unclassified Rhizobium]MBB3390270.1 hypothetical protein [Rhizobium sp. BK275]MBB3409266.1 hypothetical protein [Rhizobium sp. BK316]
MIETSQTAPSPEFIAALTELLRAAANPTPPSQPDFVDPATVEAFAQLISSVAWPIVVLVSVSLFRRQIAAMLGGLSEFKFWGMEGKISSELKQAEASAEKSGSKSDLPTTGDVARAETVDELTKHSDVNYIRKIVDQLAAQYEQTRASLPSGSNRTRAMEAIMSQMRTVGKAAARIRYELVGSPSPGKRLQAIASLQMLPDYELLNWLAERPKVEQPFVSYHAMVALNAAAQGQMAATNLPRLKQCLAIALEATASLDEGTDRRRQVQEFERTVADLEQQLRTPQQK